MARGRRGRKGLGSCCRNPLALCPRWVWLKALWLQNGSLETVEMGPVLWARLAESGALPPGTVWEPRCRQSLGVSVRGWRPGNPNRKCALLSLKGMISLVAFHAVSMRDFCFGLHKSGLKRLGNPKNTIDYNRWIWLAVAELKEA